MASRGRSISITRLLQFVFLASFIQGLSGEGSCPSWFEPIPADEMVFYWPGKCTRCLLNATTPAQVKDNCHGCIVDSGGYLEGFDTPQRMCHLEHPPAGLRSSLRTRLKGTPPRTSYVKELVHALRGRKIYYFGDSVSVQLTLFLRQRALEMGIDDALFLAPEKMCRDKSGPAFYDHMVNPEAATDRNDMLEKWESQFLHSFHLTLKGLKEEGALLVYNAGLHNGPRSGKVEGGISSVERAEMELEYRTMLQHTFKMLDKVARSQSNNSSKPFVSVFMETTAQHFPYLDGDFFFAPRPASEVERSLHEHGNGLHGVENYACLADTCADRDTTATTAAAASATAAPNGSKPWSKSWRNRAVAEVVQQQQGLHQRVFVAPLGDVTIALHDAHIVTETFKRGKSNGWGSECTHFCYSPGLAEAVAYLLYRAVDAVDRGVSPHELDWRPQGVGCARVS